MKIICNLCKRKLTRPGALIFSPPDDHDWCAKIHICYDCYHNEIIPCIGKKIKEKRK